ncbi:MAG: hypothetical protein JSR63_07950 [Proteobacteria bacterium]|nr:hypothetical protein [Pseudomonadota bacterium]
MPIAQAATLQLAGHGPLVGPGDGGLGHLEGRRARVNARPVGLVPGLASGPEIDFGD